LRGLLLAYGIRSVKRYLWNLEFSRGRWKCLEDTPGDCVYRVIERYVRDGSILDLGCGSGSTGNELPATAYRDYTGVDISDVAIEQARRRARANGRADKNRYLQSEFSGYVPSQQFDVILFRDSIYYIPQAKIKAMLNRYSSYLKKSGVFIVRLYGDGSEYKMILDTIENNFEVMEKHLSREPRALVIVFRQPA